MSKLTPQVLNLVRFLPPYTLREPGIKMAAEEKFEFSVLPLDKLGDVKNKSKESAELLQKWGLDGRMKCVTFTYNRHFQTYQKDAFALNFFQSSTVNTALEVLSSTGQWCPLSMASQVSAVSVEEVPCTILSMEFFDRLQTAGVVRESGNIVKCFDEVCGDFIISDELRKVLLQEESDNYDMYTSGEREEFLFRLFKHLALGGPVNQYEDTIQPYLDTAMLLYKELLSVVKDPTTKKLSIASHVYKVQAKVGDSVVFPGTVDHEQTFCYLIIDNFKRHVTTWYHIWY